MNNDPQFELLLRGFPVDAIGSTEETIYGLRPDLTIAYVNKGWTQFASRNGGGLSPFLKSPIDCQFLDAISSILRPFFADHFAKCLQERRPWEHHYECSSPQLRRQFVMMTYPLGKGEGLLVVNSIEQESPHSRTAHEPVDAIYRDESGLIKQRCHCRRVQRSGRVPAWDWVPDWANVFPPNTSHGLCEPCFGYYYPKQGRPTKEFPKAFRSSE